MKVHTTAFKEQIKEMGRELDSIITYGEAVLGNEQLNAVTPSFQGGILKSVMKQLDIDSNVPIPIGTILNYQFGVKVNGEYEYLNFGNYVVKDVEKQEDTMSYKITCYDKLLFSMKDYAKMPITYPITIRSYINALCSFLGIRFANNNDTFVNYNKIIPNELYLDTNGNSIGYTFRDVLDELAQVTASTICLNDNDELEIRYINDTGDTIDEEFLKNVNVNFGERYGKVNSIVLSRSGESDNVYLRDEASVSTNGLTELKIVDNQIMNFNNRDEFLSEILGKLNGLEYYLNDFASTGITYYDLCDRYNVKVGNNTYSCVMFNNEMLVTQGLEENIFTEMPQETETDYTKADKTDRKINQTYLIVDKQNQQIEAVISQTDEQNQKIAQVTQTVEELNSKISDIADITTSAEDTDAKIEINEVNQSEPIRLVVRPIGENISNLVISSNMLISDSLKLKQRIIRFTNIDTNEIFDYPLPDDLWYYDSENYDEFILDYDGQSCVINKKVGLNEDGTVYLLETPTTVEYEFPVGDNAIVLTDGNYTVEILGYDTGYIFARLMAKNIYTTQFYTKAETDSIISQTSQSIDLSVNKKLSNYSTTNEMNSAIQLSASNITSSVSENYATKTALENTSSSLNSKIEQTANSITSSVSSNYATKNELNNAKTEIKQTTDSISSTVSTKVGNNEVISKINQSAEQITINANKLNLNGYLTISNANNTYATQSNLQATNDSLQATNNNLANNYSSNTQLATSGSTIINGDNITTGTISAEILDAKVITTTNFSAQKINADNINSGTLNIRNGNTYYLKMGFGTKHPEVSGLNVTGTSSTSGIAMNGTNISGCNQIGVNVIGTHNSGVVHVNTALYADSTLYYKAWDGNYHELAGLYSWFQSGATDYIDVRDADGSTKIRLNFTNGLYTGYTRLQ